jgi:hypothetical protein
MAISQTQIVDYLLKKVGYGVAKTDTSTAKGPSNESNASPLLSPGSTIWQQDYLIPSVTTLPSANSAVVTIYRDSLSTTIQSVNLAESTTNQTWATNLTNWIPTQYGAGYQLQVYAAPSGNSAPQTYGVSLPQAGSGNSDSWYFDYQAGILNFADTNVPTAVTWNGSTGNVVYVVGARYTGQSGITNFASPITFSNTVTFGANIQANANLNLNNNLTVNGNITTGNLSTVGNVTAYRFYGDGSQLTGVSSYSNSNVAAYLPTYNGNVGANWVNANYFNGNIITSNISASGSNANISITPGSNGYVSVNTTTAFQVPVGSSSQYPIVNRVGMLRWNSDYGYLEVYTGATWEAVGIEGNNTLVTSDIFYGDSSTTTFTLSQNNTTNGTIVSINGVIQIPSVSYTVSGNSLVFTEAPVSTDVIEARSTSSSKQVTGFSEGNAALSIVNVNGIDTLEFVYNGSLKFSLDNANANVYAPIYSANNINTTANVYANSYFYSNGTPFVSSTYGNTQVAAYLPTYTGNLNPNSIITSNGGQHIGYITGAIGANGANSGAFTTVSTSGNLTVGANTNVSGNIIPSSNVTYDLGSSTNRFRTLYLANSTIDMGGVLIGTANGKLTVGGNSGQLIPAGTIMTFQQSSAPTGFTKVTTYNDYAMRIVSGSAGSGGSVAFSTAFASQSVSGTVGATTLTTSQIPPVAVSVSVTDPGHTHWISGASYDDGNFSGHNGNSQDWGLYADAGSYSSSDPNHSYGRYSLSGTTGITASGTVSGGNGSHTHTFTGTSINLAVNYLDFILAQAN